MATLMRFLTARRFAVPLTRGPLCRLDRFLGIGWTAHKNSRSTCGCITFSGILHNPGQCKGRHRNGCSLSQRGVDVHVSQPHARESRGAAPRVSQRGVDVHVSQPHARESRGAAPRVSQRGDNPHVRRPHVRESRAAAPRVTRRVPAPPSSCNGRAMLCWCSAQKLRPFPVLACGRRSTSARMRTTPHGLFDTRADSC